MSKGGELNPLGVAVRKMREEQGLTVAQIAKLISCSPDTLHRIKCDGYGQTMRRDIRKGIENVFGKEVADWFKRPPNEKKEK